MTPAAEPRPQPRVFATKVDLKTGKSSLWIDTTREEYGVGSARISNLWQTNQNPADNNDERDLGQDSRVPMNPHGTAVRQISLAPWSAGPFHRTESVDYGIVLEGTLTLGLDDGTTTDIPQGSLIVQRGTNHWWANRTPDWVRAIFVMVPAKRLHTHVGELSESVENIVVNDELPM